MVVDGLLMVVVGCCWLLLVVVGCCWLLLLVVVGCCCCCCFGHELKESPCVCPHDAAN